MTRQDTLRLLDQFRSERISRRDLIAQAVALGLGAGSIGFLSSACGVSKEKSAPDAPEAAGDLGPIEKQLTIYNWSDYIAKDTVPNFEKEFGVEVSYETYESNEEMVANLQSGGSGYDIVVPSAYIVPLLISIGLTTPLHKKYLTNWNNVAPIFVNPDYDPNNEYTVPWQWGTTGVAFRRDKLPAPPDSWAILQDARYKGKMTQMNDLRDVIGAWLRFRGHSLNSTDAMELAGAKADAIAAKKNLKGYISAPVKGQLISGEVWIAQLWNGDTTQARVEQAAIDFVIPKEGSTIWTDHCMILKSAVHKRAAHEFLNYMLRPEVGAAISNTTGYGTPNAAALAEMKNPVPYPNAEEFQRLEYQKDLGVATAMWDQVWSEIRSA